MKPTTGGIEMDEKDLTPTALLIALAQDLAASMLVKPKPEITFIYKAIDAPQTDFYPAKPSAFIPSRQAQPWKRRRK